MVESFDGILCSSSLSFFSSWRLSSWFYSLGWRRGSFLLLPCWDEVWNILTSWFELKSMIEISKFSPQISLRQGIPCANEGKVGSFIFSAWIFVSGCVISCPSTQLVRMEDYFVEDLVATLKGGRYNQHVTHENHLCWYSSNYSQLGSVLNYCEHIIFWMPECIFYNLTVIPNAKYHHFMLP